MPKLSTLDHIKILRDQLHDYSIATRINQYDLKQIDNKVRTMSTDITDLQAAINSLLQRFDQLDEKLSQWKSYLISLPRDSGKK